MMQQIFLNNNQGNHTKGGITIMTLKEMRFDEMESTKVHCIDFSKTKTNTTVKHWLNLYPMEAITGNKELQGFYIELKKEGYFTDYTVWNDCGSILAVKYFRLEEDYDISIISEIMDRNMPFKGYEGYKRMLAKKEENGAFINIVEISALIELGDTKLASHYSGYRENYIKTREEKNRELELQRQVEHQKEIEMQQKALETKIADAEECIRMNKLLQNDLLDIGNHLVLYLMKKYNINVPLKTQGWINNKLTSVVFSKDNTITVYFLRGKGCKCPQNIYKYLGLLKEAVNAAA